MKEHQLKRSMCNCIINTNSFSKKENHHSFFQFVMKQFNSIVLSTNLTYFFSGFCFYLKFSGAKSIKENMKKRLKSILKALFLN